MKQLVLAMLVLVGTVTVGTPIWAQKERPLSKDQAINLLSTAKTPEEHDRLAQYFNQKASKLETEAKEHKDLSNAYHKGKVRNMQNASLCDEAAAAETKAAQENRALADSHHKMAEDLRSGLPH